MTGLAIPMAGGAGGKKVLPIGLYDREYQCCTSWNIMMEQGLLTYGGAIALAEKHG